MNFLLQICMLMIIDVRVNLSWNMQVNFLGLSFILLFFYPIYNKYSLALSAFSNPVFISYLKVFNFFFLEVFVIVLEVSKPK